MQIQKEAATLDGTRHLYPVPPNYLLSCLITSNLLSIFSRQRPKTPFIALACAPPSLPLSPSLARALSHSPPLPVRHPWFFFTLIQRTWG